MLHCRLSTGSKEDLLAYSQAVYDNLASLSTTSKMLCTCKNDKTHCSYKNDDKCKTKTKGKEYHCVLHSSSRKKRDLNRVFRLKENTSKLEELTVSTFIIHFIITKTKMMPTVSA